MPTIPQWLLSDDGTPLPGIRTSLAGRLCMVNADGTHAGLNVSPTKKLYEGLKSLGAEEITPTATLYVNTGRPYLDPVRKTYTHGVYDPNYRGLVLSSCSMGKTECLLSVAYLTSRNRSKSVIEAWYSAACPTMNFVPCTSGAKNSNPVILPQGIVTDGISGSAETWVLYAGCCLAGFKSEAADALQASGKLCDTIREIIVDVLCAELGNPVTYPGTVPTFTIKQPAVDPLPAETFQQRQKDAHRAAHIAVAKNVARRANALGGDIADPFDTWFQSHPAATLREAWDAGVLFGKGK